MMIVVQERPANYWKSEWYRVSFALVSVRDESFCFNTYCHCLAVTHNDGGMNVQTCIAKTQCHFHGRERAEVLETRRDLQEDR